MTTKLTNAVSDPKSSRKILTFNEQFSVCVEAESARRNGYSFVVIGNKEELYELEQNFISLGMKFEPTEFEIKQAKERVLYAYNAYIDNIGIVI